MKYCLRELRMQKKITQTELANSIGVSKGAVGMWESGKRRPSLSKAIEIGQFFEIPVENIIFGR